MSKQIYLVVSVYKEMYVKFILDILINIFKNISWKQCGKLIMNVPKRLVWLLVFTLLCGCIYFTYTYITTVEHINEVLLLIITLNTKVNDVILVSDYEIDIEYLIVTLYILEEQHEIACSRSTNNTKILIEYLKKNEPNSPLIQLLEMELNRQEQLHHVLRRNFYESIKKYNPAITSRLKIPDDVE